MNSMSRGDVPLLVASKGLRKEWPAVHTVSDLVIFCVLVRMFYSRPAGFITERWVECLPSLCEALRSVLSQRKSGRIHVW